MKITGQLQLDSLLENFDALDRDFVFKVDEYEIGTTDNEYIFVKIDVYVDLDYEGDIRDYNVDVEVYPEYFGSDEDGGELELELDDDELVSLEKEIHQQISWKIKA
jgi:hypothetical protein